jgi:TPR repeat protein
MEVLIKIDGVLGTNYSTPIQWNENPYRKSKNNKIFLGRSEQILGRYERFWIGITSFVVTLLSLGVAIICRQDIREDWQSFWKGKRIVMVYAEDYSKIIDIFTARANKGDPIAQLHLGMIHMKNGLCKIGFNWFEKVISKTESRTYETDFHYVEQANLQAIPRAQAFLSCIYTKNCFGLKQSLEKAVYYCGEGVKKKDALAQNYLGELYQNGEGVKQSHSEAARYYRLSAEQGYSTAQNNLGCLYEDGLGVAKSHLEAARYYELAAEQGCSFAQYNLGHLYEKGLGVKQSHSEAARYYELAAEQGNDRAQSNLGYLYEKGLGVKQSELEAARYYELAAEQNHPKAQESLESLIDSY